MFVTLTPGVLDNLPFCPPMKNVGGAKTIMTFLFKLIFFLVTEQVEIYEWNYGNFLEVGVLSFFTLSTCPTKALCTALTHAKRFKECYRGRATTFNSFPCSSRSNLKTLQMLSSVQIEFKEPVWKSNLGDSMSLITANSKCLHFYNRTSS